MSASNGNSNGPADTGLLLVGHGSREQEGLDEFLATASLVGPLAGRSPVEACFLEFARPTIADGVAGLARRGARRIVVVPVLLFSAGHAKRDIPAAVAAVAADYPHLSVAQCGHLGCHAAILELSKLRYDEAIAPCAGAPDDTVLVIVGRGSHDLEATAEMRDFVQLRTAATAVHARACFVAMAEPRLTATLDEAVSQGARRIVVQPHLLFGGVLLDRIAQTVVDYAGRFPDVDWLTTGHLGASSQLVQAILGRAAEKLSSLRVD